MNLAFRMLGSAHDAEDVVQQTYVRWYQLGHDDREAIERPQAWLTTVASRLCLNILDSARVRREHYTGQWLPEPLPVGGARAPAARHRSPPIRSTGSSSTTR